MAQQNNFVKVTVFSKFANYFDRKIFYYRSLKEYKDNAGYNRYSYKTYPDINFNPNDGVDTFLVLNGYNVSDNSRIDLYKYNYVVVSDNSADETQNAISRWYITEVVRNADGLFTLTLRRDVVAEVMGDDLYYGQSSFSYSPFYVERGIIKEVNNNTLPLLVVDEGMNFNQIKKREELLWDKTRSPWVVAYFANNTPSTTVNFGASTPATPALSLAQLSSATGIPEDSLEAMISGTAPVVTGDIKMNWAYYQDGSIIMTYNRWELIFSNDFLDYDNNFLWEAAWSNIMGVYPREMNNVAVKTVLTDNLLTTFLTTSENSLKAMMEKVINDQYPTEHFINSSMYLLLKEYAERKVVITHNGKYYTMSLTPRGIESHATVEGIRNQNSTLDSLIASTDSCVIGGQTYSAETKPDGKVYFDYNYTNYHIELTEVPAPGTTYAYHFDIPTTHNYLVDGGYSMIAFPLDPIYFDPNGDGEPEDFTTSMERSIAIRAATSLGITLASNLIDIQLLPYAPAIVQKHIKEANGINYVDVYELSEHHDYECIKDSADDVVGYVFFDLEAEYELTIPTNIYPEYDFKEGSNTTMLRLVSPNYAGAFDFNQYRDGGYIGFFTARYTYKPFNPFISVVPQFNLLYGMDFGDNRGLICGGDFSLPVITDQWKQYENNNKMYGQIFARDIQNMEFKQGQERFKEPFAVLSGTAVGAGAGALAGAKAGPYGAIAGAVVGAGAGLAGGLIDMSLNEAARQEEKRYAFDRFNLSLASIKAMPQSLTKNSSLTKIHKLVPFVEFYDCSLEEHRIFKERIKYNGMIVGKIDYISGYINDNLLDRSRLTFNYFKGELIHLEEVAEDSHFASALYEEFKKGVYI